MDYLGEIYTVYIKYLLPENKEQGELGFQKNFNENQKLEAFDFFKKKCAICNGRFKNWKSVKGINHFEWHNDNFYYILELRTFPLYSL